jgi:hypothetical protein
MPCSLRRFSNMCEECPRVAARGVPRHGVSVPPWARGRVPAGRLDATRKRPSWRCDMGIIVTILAIIGLIVVLSMIF